MTALRVLPPDEYIGAVEAVPEITDAIAAAARQRRGLPASSDDIYFDDRQQRPTSASESHYDRDTMLRLFGERGGDPQHAGKRDPLDSLLWRGHRVGEPFWDTSIGAGRPGWHIECSVIALQPARHGLRRAGRRLRPDLPAPRALRRARRGADRQHPFAQHYVHAGMIGLDGEKMSKSRGNLVLVSKLRAAGIDPMAVRLALLDGHYRDDREWTGGRLPAAEARLARWRARGRPKPAGAPAEPVLAESGPGWPTTSTPTARSPRSTAGPTPTTPRADKAPGLIRDAVDALLGIAL